VADRVLKRPGKALIWPVNIDLTKTAGQGRKIRRELCVATPKLQEISRAAESLGLEYEVHKDASRPNSWLDKTGYIIVDKRHNSKRKILEMLASEIKRLRSA